MSLGKVSMRATSGFTLIEILAVVVVIGIVSAGTAYVFFSEGEKQEFERAVERFAQFGERAGELSILTGQPVGLVMTPPPWSELGADKQAWIYRWRRFVEVPTDEGILAEWQNIEGVEAVVLDYDIELFVHLEGGDWEWQAIPKSEQPIFVLYPSGEAEPYLFKVEFVHSNPELAPQHVSLNSEGQLQWDERAEAFDELGQP